MSGGRKRALAIVAALLIAGLLASSELIESDDDSWPVESFEQVGDRDRPEQTEGVVEVGSDGVAPAPPLEAARTVESGAEDAAPEAAAAEFEQESGRALEGALEATADDRFLPNTSARLLFESYYVAFAGQSDDLVRGRVVLHALDSLPPRAADEAIRVLDLWRDARRAVASLGVAPSAEAVREAREGALGPELLAALYEER